jgi:hypothetical protein
MLTVTAEISTKDRYATTLPLAMMTVASQTYPIERLVVYDDGEHKDLREVEPYPSIFYALDQKKIAWEVIYAPRKGQVFNHEHALRTAKTDLIWRLDDDDFADSTVLEKMVAHMDDPTVGAVSGKVWTRGMPVPAVMCSGKIEDLRNSQNVQWSDFSEVTDVDHLHNTFLYRREAGLQNGYPQNLSPVGHGEETLFTYGIRRAGYKLLLDPDVKIWHLRGGTGGIRSGVEQWFKDDEAKTNEHLMLVGVKFSADAGTAQHLSNKMIVLDNGIGDHLMFKMILPEIKAKYGKTVIACCYPEVFKDESDVALISIAQAKSIVGSIEPYSVYAWCETNGWTGSLVDAFRKMYL